MLINRDALYSLQIFEDESHANAHSTVKKEGLSLYGGLRHPEPTHVVRLKSSNRYTQSCKDTDGKDTYEEVAPTTFTGYKHPKCPIRCS